ncbi:type II/IV secretion system ATPase subunit [Hyperthermus butylicus]|uniref:TypeII/TypeIV secretory system protein, ATPase n=1 Tax=Hyperthermus butylicus (strain DSM 5456 / JCM 9403 / PLM1-5) TaxID=415426 RepID=A2BJC4_HYPBU|nr:type II/IV secretion system ATPase subunit [Hyperthermus butylicus]ABM80085.1 TypeII/TypeIV secretory system protein, ATPase [Hyperthermus butylicus DSM 5456]
MAARHEGRAGVNNDRIDAALENIDSVGGTGEKLRILREYSLLEEPRVAVSIVEDEDGRRFYNVFEPKLSDIGRRILDRLRSKIIGDLRLLKLFSELTDLGEGLREAYRLARRLVMWHRKELRKLRRDPEQEALGVAYYIARDLVGYGRIDPLIRDPYIEDISCNGLLSPVFVYHTEFEWLTTGITFESTEELEHVVMKLALRSGQEPSLARPVVEGVLKPEGYRVHIVLDVVSRRGHSFTVRKFRAEPFTITELIRRGTLDPGVAAMLWAAIQYKQGVIIYGPIGAGKTTLLNALAMLLPPEYKVVTIEDTPEISIPFHDNWTAMHTRLSDQPGVQNITLQAQVESALRMRPDVIILGEIRSREAYAFFQALATGHGGITTVHAESADVLIRRLASPPMNVPKSIIAAAKLYVHMLRIERRGHVYRKVIKVDEARDYDPVRDEVEIGRLIVWDSHNDVWRLVVEESSFVNAIADLLLAKPSEVWKDIEMRATVLKWAAERGADVLELHEIVRRYMREPEKVYVEALSETKPYTFAAGLGV